MPDITPGDALAMYQSTLVAGQRAYPLLVLWGPDDDMYVLTLIDYAPTPLDALRKLDASQPGLLLGDRLPVRAMLSLVARATALTDDGVASSPAVVIVSVGGGADWVVMSAFDDDGWHEPLLLPDVGDDPIVEAMRALVSHGQPS